MLPESTHRRLAFILYLFRLGMEQVRQPEPLNAAALLTLHDSVELLLGLACEQRNVGSKRMHFEEYFNQLDQLFPPAGVAERMAMLRLNSARVELKHRGTRPSPFDISSLSGAVASFFEANVPLMFGVPLAEVSLAHLVSLPEARDALVRVDKAIEEGRLAETLVDLALAFALVLREHEISCRAHVSHFAFSGGANDEAELRKMGQVVTSVAAGVSELRQEMGMIRHGVDTRRLEVFRSLTPSVMFAAAGNPLYTGRATNPTIEEVRFCYDFVIASVLSIQQSAAATQPFKRKRP